MGCDKKGGDDHLKVLFFLLRMSIDEEYVFEEVDKLSSHEANALMDMFIPDELIGLLTTIHRDDLSKTSLLARQFRQRPALLVSALNRVARKGPEFVEQVLETSLLLGLDLLEKSDLFLALRPMLLSFLGSESGAAVLQIELSRQKGPKQLTLLHDSERVSDILPLLSRQIMLEGRTISSLRAREISGISMRSDSKLTFVQVKKILSICEGWQSPIHDEKVFKNLLPLLLELNISEIKELLSIENLKLIGNRIVSVKAVFVTKIFSIAFPWMLEHYHIDQVVEMLTIHEPRGEEFTPLHCEGCLEIALPYMEKLTPEESEKLLEIKSKNGESVKNWALSKYYFLFNQYQNLI